MKETLLAFVVSREAIMIYAVLAVFGLSVLVKKTGVKKDYVDIAVDCYNYLEDNYKELGIFGDEKLKFFLNEFENQYKNHYGENPTDDIVGIVFKLVEDWVAKQNENR